MLQHLPASAAQVLQYIDETLAVHTETPAAFGLHNNAEIGFRLREAERFSEQLSSLRPRSSGAVGGSGGTVEERAKTVSPSS